MTLEHSSDSRLFVLSRSSLRKTSGKTSKRIVHLKSKGSQSKSNFKDVFIHQENSLSKPTLGET